MKAKYRKIPLKVDRIALVVPPLSYSLSDSRCFYIALQAVSVAIK